MKVYTTPRPMLDEDDMASDSATALATQQSIKAYADNSALPTGWVDANESWSYSSWDDTNGVSTAVITVPSDATTKYQAGMRVKFTQSTDGVKYGIITKVAETALTVFMNTDYDFDNEDITNPFYSPMKVPFGFDLDPDKYAVEYTSTADIDLTVNSSSAWEEFDTAVTIDIPIGRWYVSYQLATYDICDVNFSPRRTLSTTTNSETDSRFTKTVYLTTDRYDIDLFIENLIDISTKDTYNLLGYANQGSGQNTRLRNRGTLRDTIIRAVCAYL